MTECSSPEKGTPSTHRGQHLHNFTVSLPKDIKAEDIHKVFQISNAQLLESFRRQDEAEGSDKEANQTAGSNK